MLKGVASLRKTLRDYWFLQRPLQEDRRKAYLAEN
jgi:hypothetical protein